MFEVLWNVSPLDNYLIDVSFHKKVLSHATPKQKDQLLPSLFAVGNRSGKCLTKDWFWPSCLEKANNGTNECSRSADDSMRMTLRNGLILLWYVSSINILLCFVLVGEANLMLIVDWRFKDCFEGTSIVILFCLRTTVWKARLKGKEAKRYEC